MDGNGRWAKRKNSPRIYGHQSAVRVVRQIVEISAKLEIDTLTLYAFSTENWSRPEEEVHFLMKLLEEYIKKELTTLAKNNIRLRLLGNRNRLPEFLTEPLEVALRETKDKTGMRLCIALDYGSRDEIVQACRKIAQKAVGKGLQVADITEALFSDHLFTRGMDDPDLIIRTSGELRLSNFLLWQAAYAEFYFTETLWPDFDGKEYYRALADFSKRKRRKGKVYDDK